MNGLDIAEQTQVAREVLHKSGINPDSVLWGIGFMSVEELAQASHDKRISMGANYSALTWKFLANSAEKRIDKALAATPWLLAGFATALAITQGQKRYAIAAFVALLVNSIAKRSAEMGNAVGGIGLMSVIATAVAGRWTWAGILLAITVASFCGRARIMYYSEVIASRALLSSEIFALLFTTNRVNLRENATGQQIFYAGDSLPPNATTSPGEAPSLSAISSRSTTRRTHFD